MDNVMVLNGAGAVIERIYRELPEKYPNNEIDAFVVMPNHVHGIIEIENETSVGAAPSGRTSTTETSVGAAPCGRTSSSTLNIEIGLENTLEPMDKGHTIKGHTRGCAPTGAKRITLFDIIHRFKSFTTTLYSQGVKQQGWQPFPGR